MTHQKRENNSTTIKISEDQAIHLNGMLQEVKDSYDVELHPLAEKAFAHKLSHLVSDEPLGYLAHIMRQVNTIVTIMAHNPTTSPVDLYRNYLHLHEMFNLVHDMAWHQHLERFKE
jgi:hypothetical protein